MDKIYDKKSFGKFGEHVAKEYLIKNNYKIVMTNFCFQHGEIDIIALKNSTLAFIEVKARNNIDSICALLAITKKKRIRITKTAIQFLNKYEKYQNYSFRFDAITVTQNKNSDNYSIKHYIDIFNCNL